MQPWWGSLVEWGLVAFALAGGAYYLSWRALPADLRAAKTKEPSRVSWQRIIGGLFWIFGIVNGLGALNMGVDVQTDAGPVANLELMHQRSVALGVSAVCLLVGTLLILLGKSTAERNPQRADASALSKLAELHAEGVLSDIEFAAKSAELVRKANIS